MSALPVGDIHRHLQNLTSLERARELFADLNYEAVVPAPLPRSDWRGDLPQALAEDPMVIARHGEFRVIYCHLSASTLDRGTERRVVKQLLHGVRYGLYLFSNSDQSQWHFVNVKYEADEQRRQVLRRFTVGPDERQGNWLRTVSQQLLAVALRDDELEALERNPLTIQQRHDEAFDVETVTKAFYQKYHEVFEAAEARIEGFGSDSERKRLFTQRLFNRLMFIAFIQRKGWLTVERQDGYNYLGALWHNYLQARERREAANFYQDRLKPLFFRGLNSPHEDATWDLRPIIGDVPYLNGGLFEADEDDRRAGITVPDEVPRTIFHDLFERFNFTIQESTPLDVEVAVDPEMLGKVFEELVTGRHDSGSYYTPKPIVAFMCREALKGYLQAARPGETVEAIELFVGGRDPSLLHDPEAVLDALKRMTVCDPACGSGAYLLGMLQELLELRAKLFAVRSVDPVSTYQRKLEIIEGNLYGVDIDSFAVNIARLRLWLSLAVDFVTDRGNVKPEPLPNLDFKIEQGDSLLSRGPRTGQFVQNSRLVDGYRQLKDAFITARSVRKQELRQKIAAAKAELVEWGQQFSSGGVGTGLNWFVEFAEVFANGGFDVVLANPPYVRQELIKGLKPALREVFGDYYNGTADLYVFFYFRALQLLKPGGMLAFISSNKWFRAGYGAKLRAHIAATTAVRSITDFRDLPVFAGATAYPMIFIAQKGRTPGKVRYTEVPSLDSPYPDVDEVITKHGQELPAGALDGMNWTLADRATSERIQIMKSAGTTLGAYVNEQIYYGVKTGFNKAFVIDGGKRAELIAADPRSAEIIKPFVVGKDIARWRVDYQDRWLITTKIGVDMARYPAVFEHLKQWQPQLEKRWDKGKHWWELRPCDYYDAFDKPKIIYPVIAKSAPFALDRRQAYSNDKTYIIPSDDTFLLGLLNSAPFWSIIMGKCSMLRGGFWELRRAHLAVFPIPNAEAADRSAIADLAQCCTAAAEQGSEVAGWEAEINARVARLYGLSEG